MAEASTIENNKWTEIITPAKRLLDIRLHEVWRYKDLMFLFVKRDMASQYKQTILGPVWFIIQPIFTTLVFFFLFNKVAGIKTDPIPAPVFYMCGISIWNYFSSCFTATSTIFVSNAGIFGKVYFPRLVLPISIVISNIIKFSIQFGLLVILIIYFSLTNNTFTYHFGLNLLLLPVVVLVMAAFGLGAGIIASSLTTKYRDFAVLIAFGVQLLMYVTPVAYSLKYISQKTHYQTLVLSNPLSSLVEGFRYAVLGIGDLSIGWFLYSCLFTLVILVIGIILFSTVERTFMDTV